jgi:excisionase family DNA binding protein
VTVEKLLTPREATTILGIGYRTLKEWIHRGKVRSIKTFGGHRVPESEIE